MINYPARFVKEKGNNGYSVFFIDIPNAFTCGETIDECFDHAKECLNLMLETDLDDGNTIPSPSPISGENIYLIPLEPNVSFALELRQLRGNRTQKEIATKLGVTYQTYQRLENPRVSNPTLKTIKRIANVLNCHFDFSLTA